MTLTRRGGAMKAARRCKSLYCDMERPVDFNKLSETCHQQQLAIAAFDRACERIPAHRRALKRLRKRLAGLDTQDY